MLFCFLLLLLYIKMENLQSSFLGKVVSGIPALPPRFCGFCPPIGLQQKSKPHPDGFLPNRRTFCASRNRLRPPSACENMKCGRTPSLRDSASISVARRVHTEADAADRIRRTGRHIPGPPKENPLTKAGILKTCNSEEKARRSFAGAPRFDSYRLLSIQLEKPAAIPERKASVCAAPRLFPAHLPQHPSYSPSSA